jgi:DNA-binding GntR family transcriptional regulator
MGQEPRPVEAVTKDTPKAHYEIVQAWIVENIAAGNLPSGTRLTVASVADRLRVSRSPVKRALELLAASLALTRDGGQGYVVGPATTGTAAGPANLFMLHLTDPGAEEMARPGWERILDDVAEAVAGAIPFGIYQISEAGIGEHFGVSRTVTREVLARLQERGVIGKDRASHWVAGPLSARMLDEEHGLRRLMEPAALSEAAAALRPLVPEMLQRIADAGPRCSPADMDRIESDLHDRCLPLQQNRRMSATLAQLRTARRVNRLFALHVVQHDETATLAEHRLVLDHIALGDPGGAAVALLHHLNADHLRTRDRLKVLSVFVDPVVAPYLERVG